MGGHRKVTSQELKKFPSPVWNSDLMFIPFMRVRE